MLDLDRMSLVMPDVIADLEALQDRLRDRDAAQAPETLAGAANAVRALIALLGTSQGGLARELGGRQRKDRARLVRRQGAARASGCARNAPSCGAHGCPAPIGHGRDHEQGCALR